MTPGGRRRLQPVHHPGAELRRRHADPEPLRRQHDQLADPGGAVRAARQAGQRQGLRHRRAAVLAPDGAGRGRTRSRASSARPTGTGRCRTRAARRSSRASARSTASRRRRRRTPATCRRCSTPTPASAPAPSSPARWSPRSKASSSTAWATARPSTAPRTTSASRTCWSCAARRTLLLVRPARGGRGHAARPGRVPGRSPDVLGRPARAVQQRRLSPDACRARSIASGPGAGVPPAVTPARQ